MHGTTVEKKKQLGMSIKSSLGKNAFATGLQTFYCGLVRGPQAVKTTVSGKCNYLRLQ